MSDQKLDLILSKLDQMEASINERFNRNEEMIGTLIQMVGNIGAKQEEITAEVVECRGNARYLNHRLADLEMEVEKLKNR